MVTQRGVRKFLAVVATALAVMAITTVSVGSDAHRTIEPHDVVAEGLYGPRHLDMSQNGRLYVAESGIGGPYQADTPLGPNPGPTCVGTTGRISEIVRGEVRPFITGLPSATQIAGEDCTSEGNGFFATGPHGLDMNRMMANYTIGLGGLSPARDVLAGVVPEASHMGTVTSERWGPVDLVAFEEANDPDTTGPDSNPYGVYRESARSLLVADAGANALLRVDRHQGTSVVAAFAPRCVPWGLPFDNPVPPEFNPCGTQELFPSDPVPTGVAMTGNGDILVSTLGGFPFVPGYSLIYRIDGDYAGTAICSTFDPVPAAGCEVFADGLTSLVDLEVAPDGKVYAVQFSDMGVGALEGGAPGADAGSVQILHRRTGENMGSIVNLTLPGGVAIDGRDVYISNGSVFPGFGSIVVAHTLCTQLLKDVCQAG